MELDYQAVEKLFGKFYWGSKNIYKTIRFLERSS